MIIQPDWGSLDWLWQIISCDISKEKILQEGRKKKIATGGKEIENLAIALQRKKKKKKDR